MIATPALVVVLLGADPASRFGAASANRVPADQAAAIALDQKAAQAEVQKKYGNKKPSELSNEERSQMIREQAAAEQRVLDKYGVDAKAWALQQMAQSPQEAAAQKAREQALADQRQKDAEAKAKAQAGDQEIQIQRGFSDGNPVTLEEKKVDGVPVEEGLPPDAVADQAEAAGDGTMNMSASDMNDKPAPSKASKGPSKGGRKR
jgi:hypothetical protein